LKIGRTLRGGIVRVPIFGHQLSDALLALLGHHANKAQTLELGLISMYARKASSASARRFVSA